MPYSEVTKKGQTTMPSHFGRQQDGFGGRVVVTFKKTRDGFAVEPTRDMTESAGKLSRFGTADEVVRDLLRLRERDFR